MSPYYCLNTFSNTVGSSYSCRGENSPIHTLVNTYNRRRCGSKCFWRLSKYNAPSQWLSLFVYVNPAPWMVTILYIFLHPKNSCARIFGNENMCMCFVNNFMFTERNSLKKYIDWLACRKSSSKTFTMHAIKVLYGPRLVDGSSLLLSV